VGDQLSSGLFSLSNFDLQFAAVALEVHGIDQEHRFAFADCSE
jgi:hypothetical protein